jgi:3-dehydroquinate dehydratase type I
MKIAVSIFLNQNLIQLKEKIKTAKLGGADVVELRADSEPEISEDDLLELKTISNNLKIPVIFTLRSKKEGGKYNFPFAKKLKLTEKVLSLNFDYLDIELEFLEKLKKSVPDLKGGSITKIILSKHNLKGTETLAGLKRIKKRMLDLKPDIIKIAVLARNKETSKNILKLIKEARGEGKNIIGIVMGERGKDVRLKALADNYFSYFCLNEKEKTAPGQPSLNEFKKQTKLTEVRHLLTLINQNEVGKKENSKH